MALAVVTGQRYYYGWDFKTPTLQAYLIPPTNSVTFSEIEKKRLEKKSEYDFSEKFHSMILLLAIITSFSIRKCSKILEKKPETNDLHTKLAMK